MSVHVIDLRTKEGQTKHKQLQDSWARAWKENAIEAIHRHAEFRFTADGRFYSMVLDGEAIGHLMNTIGNPDFKKNQRVWNELRSIDGAIVVCDDAHGLEGGEFLSYHDRSELIDAWHELHTISGVVMSDADAEKLDEYDEE